LDYLKIIRIPNLLIIVLTQYLLRICIIGTFYGLNDTQPAMGSFDFLLLVTSTLLIAAGGYVINDYFDTEADKINKPGKMAIGKKLSEESAYLYYWILTISGVLIGFYISFRVNYFLLGFIYIAFAMMLWFYTTRYQKTVLWGNLAVSFLSAMVLLIVWLFEFFALRADPVIYTEAMKQLGLISIIVGTYTLFAFMVTLIREMIKDIEDFEGDRICGFNTLPVKAGIRNTKILIVVLTGLTIFFLGVAQYFLFRMNLMLVFWYIMIAVQSLLLFLLFQVIKAGSASEFHFLSTATKIIMVAGILSMQLFYISY